MATDDKISMLARIARSKAVSAGSASAGAGSTGAGSTGAGKSGAGGASSTFSGGDLDTPFSILSLAAASYGARPNEDATVPTGFDPVAVALFESIVEGAFLVASADGVVDAEERRTFESVVVAACGGVVAPRQISALVSDLGDQLTEDGIDKRIAAVGRQVHKPEHAHEVLRIAALLAMASNDVSEVERVILGKLAGALQLPVTEVERAIEDVKAALANP